MPYKVTLTLLDDQSIQLTEIQNERTPNVGDIIIVGYAPGGTRAQVTRVRKHWRVDDVDARQR